MTASAAPACVDLFSSAAHIAHLGDYETKFGFEIHADLMRLSGDDQIVEIDGGLGGFAIQAWRLRGAQAVIVNSSPASLTNLPRSSIARLASVFQITASSAIFSQDVPRLTERVTREYTAAKKHVVETSKWPRGTASLLIDSQDRLARSPQTFVKFKSALRIGGRAHFDLSKASSATLDAFRQLSLEQPNAYRLEGKHLTFTRLD